MAEKVKRFCKHGIKECQYRKKVNGEEVLFKCSSLIKTNGPHPDTGEVGIHEVCADTLIPMLLMEQTQEIVTGTNATQEFRQDVVTGNQQIGKAMFVALQTASNSPIMIGNN